jgi:hypothetical protein
MQYIMYAKTKSRNIIFSKINDTEITHPSHSNWSDFWNQLFRQLNLGFDKQDEWF